MGMDLPANSRELLTAVVPRLGPSDLLGDKPGPYFSVHLVNKPPTEVEP